METCYCEIQYKKSSRICILNAGFKSQSTKYPLFKSHFKFTIPVFVNMLGDFLLSLSGYIYLLFL